MTEEARKAAFDFRAFAEGVLEIPEPTQDDLDRARVAGDLLNAIPGTDGPVQPVDEITVPTESGEAIEIQ